MPAIAQAAQIIGLAGLVYGSWTFDLAATLGGLVVVELGKCWYLDRMVLLFDALKSTYPDIAAWEH